MITFVSGGLRRSPLLILQPMTAEAKTRRQQKDHERYMRHQSERQAKQRDYYQLHREEILMKKLLRVQRERDKILRR